MTNHTEHATGNVPNEPEAGVAAEGGLLSDAQIRWVRRAVVIMTLLLVAGVVLLIGRIIYLSRPAGTQALTSTVGQPALLPDVRLALPAGAQIKSVSATGSRLVVLHTQASGGEAITILDLSTGQILSRVAIEAGK